MEITALSGVVPIVPTPLLTDGSLDELGLAHLVSFCAEQGMDAATVLGSNGEFAYLGFDEKCRVMAVAADAAAGRLPVIGSASATSTDEAVALARAAAMAGCDAVMATVPLYFDLGPDEVVGQIEAVASDGGLPVFFYLFPEVTGLLLTPEEVARVASVPGVIGAKISVTSEPFLSEVIERTRPYEWRVFTGSTYLLRSCIEAGGAGVFCPLPLLAPRLVRALLAAAVAGEHEQAVQLEWQVRRSMPIMSGLDLPADLLVDGFEAGAAAPYQSPGTRPRGTHGLVKEALRRQGHPVDSKVRRPVRPVTDDERDLVERTLRDLGWLSPPPTGGEA